MIILNTTFHIHTSIEENILHWIRAIYQQSGIDHGAKDPMLVRVLGHDQPMAATYALHLAFEDLKSAEAWNDKDGDYLRHSLTQHWGEKALPFYTYLQVID